MAKPPHPPDDRAPEPRDHSDGRLPSKGACRAYELVEINAAGLKLRMAGHAAGTLATVLAVLYLAPRAHISGGWTTALCFAVIAFSILWALLNRRCDRCDRSRSRTSSKGKGKKIKGRRSR